MEEQVFNYEMKPGMAVYMVKVEFTKPSMRRIGESGMTDRITRFALGKNPSEARRYAWAKFNTDKTPVKGVRAERARIQNINSYSVPHSLAGFSAAVRTR